MISPNSLHPSILIVVCIVNNISINSITYFFHFFNQWGKVFKVAMCTSITLIGTMWSSKNILTSYKPVYLKLVLSTLTRTKTFLSYDSITCEACFTLVSDVPVWNQIRTQHDALLPPWESVENYFFQTHFMLLSFPNLTLHVSTVLFWQVFDAPIYTSRHVKFLFFSLNGKMLQIFYLINLYYFTSNQRSHHLNLRQLHQTFFFSIA